MSTIHSFGPPGRARVVATRLWLVAASAGMAFFVAHSLGLGGARFDTFASTWVYDGLEVLALAAVAARAVLGRGERLAWVSLTVGIACQVLGDVSWSVFYGGNPPFPSLADVFYLGFYPPTYFALALLVKHRVSRFNASIWLDGVMAALAAAAVATAVLLEVILRQAHVTSLAGATNLAYPLGDVVLVALVFGVFAITGWGPGRGWVAIGAALVLTAVADCIYLYQSAVGSYVDGTILDALWPGALILLASAAWMAPGRKAEVELVGRPLAATPALCGLLALGVLVDSYAEHRTVAAVVLAAATIVTVIARTLLTFRENSAITRRVHVLAQTDPLTNLWNRRRLLADLDALLVDTGRRRSLLILCDLNGFKRYNDTFGHPAGDALLTRLAGKLSRSLAPHGICYRLGGDELCALVEVGPAGVEAILAATTTALSEEGDAFDVSTAYGCVFLPDEATTASEALRIADQRLYAQKHQSLMERGQPHGVLLQALYEREPGLREHVHGVAALCLAVGADLRLGDEAMGELELAAQLHDIGKLAVPDAILAKPGPLDAEEWELIRAHTTIGQRILEASPALNRVGQIVRATHERWDGKGYPDGLAGAGIPLPARIIAVCDAYSAMTSDRPYRLAMSPDVARAELRSCAGNQFDPEIVAAFERTHASTPVGAQPRLGEPVVHH